MIFPARAVALVVRIVVDAVERISTEKRKRLTTGLRDQNVIAVVNLHLFACWVFLSSRPSSSLLYAVKTTKSKHA